jgi:hypothetical protein
VLKRCHELKEKALRSSNSPGTRRGLMILKFFLGMEWMLILGGDLGLWIYLFFLIGFAPKYCKVTGYYAFFHSLSSVFRCAARIVLLRTAVNSSAR